MKRNYETSKIRSSCSVLGNFLMQLILGSVYAYKFVPNNIHGKANTSVTSTTKEIHSIKSQMYLFAVGMFGLSASMSLGGYIEYRLKRTKTVLLGSVIMSYGVFLTAFSISCFFLNIVTYGLMCGLGGGLIYAISLGVPSQWFQNSRGLVLGIIVSGFALGPVFLNNIRIHLEFCQDYQLLILSGIYFVIQIIGILLNKMPKKKPYEEPLNNIILQHWQPETEDVQSHKLFNQFDFWIIWLIFAMNSVGTILIQQLHETIEIFSNDGSLISNGSLNNSCVIYIVSFSNFFGRIFWGILSDNISTVANLFILNFGSCIIYAIFAYRLPFSIIFYKVMIGICTGWLSGNFVLFASLLVNRFGQKYFASNYGLIWTSYSFAGIVTSLLVIKMVEQLKITLGVLSAMSFLSFLLTIVYKRYPKRSIQIKDFEIILCCYNSA